MPLAASLAVVHVGMLFTDTLCPEHRGWVFGLSVVAVIAAGFAVVALVRGSATAASLTVAAALCGVAIGVIDAAHVPARGQLIAAAFAVVTLLATLLSLAHLRLWRWQQRVATNVAPPPRPTVGPSLDEGSPGAGYDEHIRASAPEGIDAGTPLPARWR